MKKLGDKTGSCFLTYGDYGFGKTYGLSTLPGKTWIVVTEPRDPRQVLAHALDHMEFTIPESFNDLMDSLNKWNELAQDGKFPFDNVALDSASFLMALYRLQIQDDRFDERISGKKIVTESLLEIGMMQDRDWGVLSGIMQRVTQLLNR